MATRLSEVLRLIPESDRPAAHVARELGVTDKLLYRWTSPHKQATEKDKSP